MCMAGTDYRSGQRRQRNGRGPPDPPVCLPAHRWLPRTCSPIAAVACISINYVRGGQGRPCSCCTGTRRRAPTFTPRCEA
jgi:hypothetical protein